MKKLKQRKGITLIALVITIIILLILAGITIASLTSENGLFKRAQQAKEETLKGQEEENVTLNSYVEWIDNYDEEGLLQKIGDINEQGIQNIQVKEETYSANVIILNGNIVLDGVKNIEGATLNSKIYEFGNPNTDVATATGYAKNMVILKVNGNLTINNGVTLTACKSANGYGGPKGMMIYCTGTITNNGTISMTARGAKAEGQNVYLWKNNNGSFEYVPKDGTSGSKGIYVRAANAKPEDVEKAQNRQTGGGRWCCSIS